MLPLLVLMLLSVVSTPLFKTLLCYYNQKIKTRLSLIFYAEGVRLFNEGLWQEAEEHFTLAIRHNDKVAHYYLSRGKVYYYLNQFGLSFVDYKEGLKLDPHNKELRSLLTQFSSNDREREGRGEGKLSMKPLASSGDSIEATGAGIMSKKLVSNQFED